MTKTRVGKVTKREVQGQGVYERSRWRSVIVTIEYPDLVGFRLKGTRRVFYMTAETGFMHAVKMWNAHEKAEKAKAKKLRKETR
jgi:hypothetical protein